MSSHTKKNPTATLASLGFNDDTDTGITSDAANSLVLLAGGTAIGTLTATTVALGGTTTLTTVNGTTGSISGVLTVNGLIKNIGGSVRTPSINVASIVSSVAAATTPVTYFTNPYASAVIVPRVWVYVQTACTSASGKISIGSVSATTVSANSIIDSLNIAATGLYSNEVNSSTNGKAVGAVVPASQFITGSVVNGDVTGAVGFVYTEFYPI